MATRNIVSTGVLYSHGKAWLDGAVITRLKAFGATTTHTHPADVQSWEIGVDGTFTAKLAVPDTGTWVYDFELPSGETFSAHIGKEDGSDISFEALVLGAGGAAGEVNTLLAMIGAVLAPAFAELEDGATITWDFAQYPARNASVTLEGNRTLAIENCPAGARGTLKVAQDDNGSRTLTLPAGSAVADNGQGAVTLSSGAGDIDILEFVYDGTTYFWRISADYTEAP